MWEPGHVKKKSAIAVHEDIRHKNKRKYDKAIGFCKGCLICQNTRRYVIHDDADIIPQKC